MKDQDTVQRFIELRSQGWTFTRLMAELNVTKPTLIAWSRKHQFQIQNLRAIELEALVDQWLPYAQDGQLREDYPAMAGKPIRFELRTKYPPTQREERFFDIINREHLQPAGITFGWRLIGEGPV